MAFRYQKAIALALVLCTIFTLGLTLDIPTRDWASLSYSDGTGGTGNPGGGSGGGTGGGPISPTPTRAPVPTQVNLPNPTVTDVPEATEQPELGDATPTHEPDATDEPTQEPTQEAPTATTAPTPTALPHADKCSFLGAREVMSEYWSMDLDTYSPVQSRTFSRPAGADMLAVQGYWQWQGAKTDDEPNETFRIDVPGAGSVNCRDMANSDRSSEYVYCGYVSRTAPGSITISVEHTGDDNTIGDVGAQVALRWCASTGLSELPATGELSPLAKAMIAAAILAIATVGTGLAYFILKRRREV